MNTRIRALRKSLHLSQEAFGEKLGITGGGISKLEKGDRNMTEPMIKAICREFNVNRYWLETGEGEIFKNNDSSLFNVIDNIMDSENEFAKSVFKAFAKFSDEDWKNMEKFCRNVVENIKKEPQG